MSVVVQLGIDIESTRPATDRTEEAKGFLKSHRKQVQITHILGLLTCPTLLSRRTVSPPLLGWTRSLRWFCFVASICFSVSSSFVSQTRIVVVRPQANEPQFDVEFLRKTIFTPLSAEGACLAARATRDAASHHATRRETKGWNLK